MTFPPPHLYLIRCDIVLQYGSTFFLMPKYSCKTPEFAKSSFLTGFAPYVQQFWIDAIVHILPPTFTFTLTPPPPLPPLTNLRPVRKHVPEILEHVKIIGCSASNFASGKQKIPKQKTKNKKQKKSKIIIIIMIIGIIGIKKKKTTHIHTERHQVSNIKHQTSNIQNLQRPRYCLLFVYLFVYLYFFFYLFFM